MGTKLELATQLLNDLELKSQRMLPKRIGLIRLTQCLNEWNNDPHNFVKRMQELYNLEIEDIHSLISIFRVASLK